MRKEINSAILHTFTVCYINYKKITLRCFTANKSVDFIHHVDPCTLAQRSPRVYRLPLHVTYYLPSKFAFYFMFYFTDT